MLSTWKTYKNNIRSLPLNPKIKSMGLVVVKVKNAGKELIKVLKSRNSSTSL